MQIEKLVPDTSVIIEGLVSKKIEAKEIRPVTIIIHEAVLSELEHQANLNKPIGYLGLDELDAIKELQQKFKFEIKFTGRKPSAAEIKHAKLGEIDSLIRDMAYEEDATLMTADKIQARIAKTKNIKCILVQMEVITKKIQLESFFDKLTMSVHLREKCFPFAKKGRPGDWDFVKIRETKLTKEEIQDISKEIIEETGVRRDAFIEIERAGSTIVQFEKYRIVITRPPFSDGWEITAVRPVKKLNLQDYKLSEKLQKRISEQAEGILIAGAPGMGKTTFAQALAEHYSLQNKIVKTVEAPRDLVLPDNVTQYAISHGSSQEIHDILLLSRPDNTIFDEMRNTKDFELYADLRLSGVGMAGVIHATKPIDAIQRFVGRIELGVIPHVIDTVIFIKNGEVNKILSLNMVVKVPSGMTEADLARPVVVVNDFETGKQEFELYSYGEETVVIPVQESKKSPSQALAGKTIEKELRKYADQVEVEVVSDHKAIVKVPEQCIARIIGKGGEHINKIETALGISLDIQELTHTTQGDQIPYTTNISKKAIIISTDKPDSDVTIYVDKEYLLTARTEQNGDIKLTRKHKLGKMLARAISSNKEIKLTCEF